MRKLATLSILSLILITSIGFMTNPSQEKFVSWSQGQILAQTEKIFEYGIVKLFASPIISTCTTSKNYGVFTIFDSKPNKDLGPIKTLGIFNKFFIVKRPDDNK